MSVGAAEVMFLLRLEVSNQGCDFCFGFYRKSVCVDHGSEVIRKKKKNTSGNIISLIVLILIYAITITHIKRIKDG